MAKSTHISEGRGVYKLDKFGIPIWLHNCARICEAQEEVLRLNGDNKARQRYDAKRNFVASVG